MARLSVIATVFDTTSVYICENSGCFRTHLDIAYMGSLCACEESFTTAKNKASTSIPCDLVYLITNLACVVSEYR